MHYYFMFSVNLYIGFLTHFNLILLSAFIVDVLSRKIHLLPKNCTLCKYHLNFLEVFFFVHISFDFRFTEECKTCYAHIYLHY